MMSFEINELYVGKTITKSETIGGISGLINTTFTIQSQSDETMNNKDLKKK